MKKKTLKTLALLVLAGIIGGLAFRFDLIHNLKHENPVNSSVESLSSKASNLIENSLDQRSVIDKKYLQEKFFFGEVFPSGKSYFYSTQGLNSERISWPKNLMVYTSVEGKLFEYQVEFKAQFENTTLNSLETMEITDSFFNVGDNPFDNYIQYISKSLLPFSIKKPVVAIGSSDRLAIESVVMFAEEDQKKRIAGDEDIKEAERDTVEFKENYKKEIGEDFDPTKAETVWLNTIVDAKEFYEVKLKDSHQIIKISQYLTTSLASHGYMIIIIDLYEGSERKMTVKTAHPWGVTG